jgi:hypothetical protein
MPTTSLSCSRAVLVNRNRIDVFNFTTTAINHNTSATLLFRNAVA